MKRNWFVLVLTVVCLGGMAFAQPLVPLFSLYNPEREDNFTTTDPRWQGSRMGELVGTPAYRYYRVEGRIFAHPHLGTIPLVLWYSPARGDNFTTSDPRWSTTPAVSGYYSAGIQGYVFSPGAPQPDGTIELFSLYSPSRGDNFLTTDPKWKGSRLGEQLGGPDYYFVRTEGYIYPSLWGWADLHAHPASHMAWGADGDGNNGIVWGKPGGAIEYSLASMASDMPACPIDSHGGLDADFVRRGTHKKIISTLNNLTGARHLTNGGPTFSSWPNALSLLHQQMHITSIQRAYQGGQRVMVASVTDNQLLSLLWQKVHYDPGGAIPLTTPDFDLQSARRQIAFIKRLVSLNSVWMEIAYSAADARRIIGQNKLAIVLGLEMDSLTPDQILTLVREDGVRSVIPIHLINNVQGGTAVYNDAFNALNNFVNGDRLASYNSLTNNAFYGVQYDPHLNFRLQRPQTLVSQGFDLIEGGAVWPRPVDDATFAALRYDLSVIGGHRNSLGLTPAGTDLIKSLMRQGVLIDVVHMSQESTESALHLAVSYDYPMMDSHTGIRPEGEIAGSERELLHQHANTIAALGGMIGLGTEGLAGQQVVFTGDGSPFVRFTGSVPDQKYLLSLPAYADPAISHLTFTIATGGDDLRGGNNRVWAWITIRGARHGYDLSHGDVWANGSIHSVTIELPEGTSFHQIDNVWLHTTPNAHNSIFDTADNWNVDSLRIDATLTNPDTVGTWAQQFKALLTLMKGRGAAIGTDINGFAPQLSFAVNPVVYPLTAAARFGVPPNGYTPPSLGRSTMGSGDFTVSRTFDFQTDGIAHYGMLADFMQAVSQQPGSQHAMNGLFRSANDLVEMWEKCEAAGPLIP